MQTKQVSILVFWGYYLCAPFKALTFEARPLHSFVAQHDRVLDQTDPHATARRRQDMRPRSVSTIGAIVGATGIRSGRGSATPPIALRRTSQ
jgi:hypothetical protein